MKTHGCAFVPTLAKLGLALLLAAATLGALLVLVAQAAPGGSIYYVDTFLAARDVPGDLAKAEAATAGWGAWAPLGGPNIAGGLGRALAVHPTISGTLYAAVRPIGTDWNWNLPSVIYESTDGGANWTSLYTTPHNVKALAVTGTTIYAGAYNRIDYAPQPVLYRSGDGGLNWTTPISFADGTIWALDVHPTLAQTAIAGGADYPDEAMLYQTTDGGISWTESFSYTNPGGYSAVNTVLIHPTTPLTWLLSHDGQVGGTDGAYIVRSTDGGVNWTEVYTITDDYITDLVANPITPTIIYAATNNNNLYRSADGGATWVAVVTDDSAGWQLALDPPNTLYACMEYSWEVRKSTDGGDTWSTVGRANGEVWDLAINLGSTPATLYAGLDKSTDGGTTWVGNYNGIVTPAWPWDIDVDPQNPDRLFVAGHCSGGFATNDGGDTWTQPSGLPACMSEFAINPVDPDIVYGGAGACDQGAVLRSADGGLTFQTIYTAPFIASDCSAGQASIYALAIAPSMSSTVYAAGGDQLNWELEQAAALRSLDDGVSWTEVFTLSGESSIHPMAIHPADDDIVFVGGYDCTSGPCIGIIYRTTDGGDSWTLVLTSTVEVSSIAFDSTVPDTVYAADYGSRVYKSTDGGDSWTVVRCPSWETCVNPGLSGDMLAADPRRSGAIFLSGWGYVGESTDGGQTWSSWDDPLNQGMVEASFSYLATDSGAITQTLYGGHYGVWVYRRAALPGGIIRVATTGTDAPSCGSAALPCRTVQYAVDKARPGDEIRVATGTYTGVQAREGITQVVYVSKTVTVRGGYTTADWATSDPVANPTTLDAQGLGRVLVITGTVSTVEGLRITSGDATGMGGGSGGYDAGGGVYLYAATATISQCVIFGNTASTTRDGYGGGLYLSFDSSVLSGNTVVSNTASTASLGYGGGLYLGNSLTTLSSNTISSNTASAASITYDGFGGGLCLSFSDATLQGNTVQGNTASTASYGHGGGLYLWESDATLSDNTVRGNTASTTEDGEGGGLYLIASAATLQGNTVVSNAASTAGWGYGGGLYLLSDATLDDNTVQGNIASTADRGYGGGLWLVGCVATLQNNTVVSNTASTASDGYGGGLYLEESFDTLSGNTVVSNTASAASYGYGGGIYLRYDNATLEGNTVQGNAASRNGSGYGGGLYHEGSLAVLSANTIISNTAGTDAGSAGGGLYAYTSGPLTLSNNLVAGNRGTPGGQGRGSGLYFEGELAGATTADLLHTTIADNAASGSGEGVYVGEHTILALANTIIAGHASVGITVTAGSTATLEGTLWHDNGADTSGGGAIVTGTVNVTGDPAFVDPGGGDYHIRTESMALDAGLFAGATADLDGDTRPVYTAQPDAPDMGADENKDTAVHRMVTDTMTFGAACARIVFTDTGSLTEITVTVVYTYPTSQSGSRPLPRYYVITPTGSGPYTATLALCYTDEEFNQSDVSSEDDLQLYRFSGSSWDAHASTVNTATNVITALQVTAFSEWAEGGPGGEPGPTAVNLSSFTAEWDSRRVLAAWETALEIDTVGFNLWRSTDPGKGYVRVNETLIPAASPGGVWGGSYSYEDSDVTPGTTYYYKLEELEVGGARNWYGPVSTGKGPTATTLLSFMVQNPVSVAPIWWLAVATVGVSAVILACVRRRL